MRIVHAADLHVDSPMIGLDRYPGCPSEQMRVATRRALDNVVALCLRVGASVLLLAGDVFDGNWRDFNSGLYFVHALRPLLEGGVQVLLVRGNHDAANEMTRSLRLPEGIHVFPTDEAGTWTPPGGGPIAVHGLSYRMREVREDLVPRYPAPRKDVVNIGVLHSNVGSRPGHEVYAPTTVSALVARGYDYWALGHVHEHLVLHQDPYIVYPGNTQGRSVRETGPKGCCVLDIDASAARIRGLAWEPVDVARWAWVKVGLGADDGLESVSERAARALEPAIVEAGGRTLAVRLELTGATAAHDRIRANAEGLASQLRSDLGALSGSLWIEKVRMSTRPLTTGGGAGVLGEALRGLDRLVGDPVALRQLLGEDAEAIEGLARVVRRQDHELPDAEVPELTEAEFGGRLLAAARALLEGRLGEGRS